jgi:hypothetical protein
LKAINDDLKMQPITFQKVFPKNTSIYNQLQFKISYLDDPGKIAEAFVKHFYIAYTNNNCPEVRPVSILSFDSLLLVPISDLNIQKAIK